MIGIPFPCAQSSNARLIRFSKIRIGAALLIVLCGQGCKRKAAAPTPSATTDSNAVVNDDSQPVYPVVTSDPDPGAVRICVALQDRPREFRARCTGAKPGLSFAGMCTSALTAAIRSGALRLDASDAEACAKAVERSLQSCDGIPSIDPPAPVECDRVVWGMRREGATCRSSLECVEGLRCHGASPTSTGRCGRPRADGETCGGTIDALATYARQDRFDQSHPECSGYCSDHRCAPKAPRGGACRATVGCSAGDTCIGGRCQGPNP